MPLALSILYISPHLSSNLQTPSSNYLLHTSTWMSHGHLKSNMCKTEPSFCPADVYFSHPCLRLSSLINGPTTQSSLEPGTRGSPLILLSLSSYSVHHHSCLCPCRTFPNLSTSCILTIMSRSQHDCLQLG